MWSANPREGKAQISSVSSEICPFRCRSKGEGFGMETGRLWRKGCLWGLRKRFQEEVMPVLNPEG